MNIPKQISDKFEEQFIFNLSDQLRDSRLILIAYPYWEAFTSAVGSDIWVRIFPTLNLFHSGIVIKQKLKREESPFPKGTLFHQKNSKILKCEEFINLIPSKIRNLTKRYKESHWDIIETLILLGKDLENLIVSNPAMAYLTVNMDKVNPSVQYSNKRELLLRIIKTKQIEILGLARLPATESIRKIFMKIIMDNVSEKQFVRFCRTFPKEGDELKKLSKVLSHLEEINSNIIQLVNFDRELLFSLNKNIVVNLAHSNVNHESIGILKRIYSRCKSVHLTFPRIKSLEDLPSIDKVNFEKVKKKRILMLRFPKPHIKGSDTIIPLQNAKEHESWSKKQSNCIRGYSQKVRDRKLFFYKVIMNDEEATLEIKIQNSKVELGRLLGKKNSKVSAKLNSHVEDWFLNECGNNIN